MDAAGAAVTASEERYRQLAERFPEAIAVHSEGKLVYVNPAGARLVGAADPAELIGRPVIDFVHSDSREFVLARMRRTAEERLIADQVEMRFVRLDGQPIDVETVASPVVYEGRPATQVLVRDITARKQAERERQQLLARLGEAEARYRGLFEGVDDAILVADAEARYLDANPAATRLLGYSRDELLRMRVADVVARGPAWTDAEYGRFLREGSWSGELELRRRDGSLVPVEARATILRLPSVTLYVSAVRDITDRKRAEATLRQSRDQLAVILRGVADGITAQAADGHLIYANDAAAQVLGFPTAAELLATPLAEVMRQFEIVDEAGRSLPLEALPNRRALQGEAVVEELVRFRIVSTRDERWSTVTSTPVFDERRAVQFIITIFRDVTERRRSEERLRFLADAGALLPSTLDLDEAVAGIARIAAGTLADWGVVYLVGPDETIQSSAVAHRDPAKQAIAEEFGRRYPPEPSDRSLMWQVLRSGERALVPEIPDSLLAHAARDEEHLRVMRSLGLTSAIWVPLVAHERTLGVLGLFTAESLRRFSRSDLVLAEEIARRAALAIDNARLYQEAQEAIRARDEFLSIASHELRTPISAVKITAQLLQRSRARGALDEARLDRGLDSLVESSDRLSVLTDDLLDVARLRTGRLELNLRRLDPAALVREVAELHRDQIVERHSLALEIEEVRAVDADPDRVGQVLANLLTNAVKYSPDGGPIGICARPEDGGVLVEVRDAGIGLPAGAEETIFEPFGRAPNAAARQIQGMGLGLHIARSIIERHGGRIWAESAGEDRGTTMRVWLPCAEPGGAPTPAAG